MSDRKNHSQGPKIHRIGKKYHLEDLDDELVERYTRRSNSLSLRELATYCNQRVLEAAMTENGMRPLEGEVENIYELLTGDDVSAGMQTQARNRLERNGIDVDEVTADFVSYQTVRRYLDDHLNVQRDQTPDEETKQRRLNRIFSLESRLTKVTEQTLDQLQRDHDLTLGDPEVMVNIDISCSECGEYATARELIDSGGCDCS